MTLSYLQEWALSVAPIQLASIFRLERASIKA